MNEFIIWDERYRVFRKLLKIDFELGLYFCIDKVVPFEKGVLVKNIGLKDINGKSIYADCSIVEFNNSINQNHTYKGVFYYLPIEARYMIKVFNKNNFEIWFYNSDKILNLQIVDTVQQNKLGLIK